MIKISRHARNNKRLYKIKDTEIKETMESPDSTEKEGERQVVIKKFPGRFGGFPLKVVYKEVGRVKLVITAYPLKRKHWG